MMGFGSGPNAAPWGIAMKRPFLRVALRAKPLVAVTAAITGAALLTGSPACAAELVPGAPGGLHAVAGDHSATFTITPATGGGPPESYVVSADHESGSCAVIVPADSCTVTGLMGGGTYLFTAVAVNAAGTSLPAATTVTIPHTVFSDVGPTNPFYKEITWAGDMLVATGWTTVDGSKAFHPLEPVGRDAMAAFLFRMLSVQSDYTPPATSPFSDVTPSNPYYKEISWLAVSGISTGWPEPDGTRTYRPLTPITRDAMAAFLYRANLWVNHVAPPPTSCPFTDVTGRTPFHDEICWAASIPLTKGWTEPDGTLTFRPFDLVNRDAMAAFTYRFRNGPLWE